MRPRLTDMLESVIEEGLTSDRVLDLAQKVFQQILQSFKESGTAPLATLTNATAIVDNSKSCVNGPLEFELVGGEVPHSGTLDDPIQTGDVARIGSSAHPGLLESAAISMNSPGVFDIFQTMVLQPLDSSQWCNLDDLLYPSEDASSHADSGYGSLLRADTEQILYHPDPDVGVRYLKES